MYDDLDNDADNDGIADNDGMARIPRDWDSPEIMVDQIGALTAFSQYMGSAKTRLWKKFNGKIFT